MAVVITMERFEKFVRLEKAVDTILSMLEDKAYVDEEEILEIIGTERARELFESRKKSRESMTAALNFAQRFEPGSEGEECKVD